MGMPDVTQELKGFVSDMLGCIHTALPGKVVSYNADRGEADVLPFGKFKKPDGNVIDYPRISGVPVLSLQGAAQGAVIAYPIKEGDECLLLFTEQPLDIWRTGAATSTDLSFDLTNAVAIVGLFAKASHVAKEAAKRDAVIIDRNGARIMLLPNNSVAIVANVTIRGSLSVSGGINSGELNLDSHTHVSSEPGRNTGGPI